jgi:hypothetical protein
MPRDAGRRTSRVEAARAPPCVATAAAAPVEAAVAAAPSLPRRSRCSRRHASAWLCAAAARSSRYRSSRKSRPACVSSDRSISYSISCSISCGSSTGCGGCSGCGPPGDTPLPCHGGISGGGDPSERDILSEPPWRSHSSRAWPPLGITPDRAPPPREKCGREKSWDVSGGCTQRETPCEAGSGCVVASCALRAASPSTSLRLPRPSTHPAPPPPPPSL